MGGKKDVACPACGARLAMVVYGLVGPELVEADRRGEVWLGGCIISSDDPRYRCPECGRFFRNDLSEHRSEDVEE
jgi:DNA-directed RNA polymerase subunit RPC12/RpoP